MVTSVSGAIVKAHGGLTGLSNDEHTQYHTDARGDVRYYGKTAVDNMVTSVSGAIVKAHGGLTGLSNDEHTQYILANGTRAFSSTVSGVAPTASNHLTTKAYVDSLLSGQSSIFGSEFYTSSSLGESNTNSNSPIVKLNLTTGSLVGGTYRIGWYYEWRRNSTNSFYIGDVIIDDSITIMNHYEAPQHNSNYSPLCGFIITNLVSGIHSIDLRYYGSNSGNTNYIRKAMIEMWRIN
jgi:hypothetical protein